MKAEVKKRWTDALRSGKYEQGKGALCRAAKYCCLGVLAAEEGLFDPVHLVRGARSVASRAGYLPPSVIDIVGDLPQQGILARMNDRGKSFAEIADWIDEKVEETK